MRSNGNLPLVDRFQGNRYGIEKVSVSIWKVQMHLETGPPPNKVDGFCYKQEGDKAVCWPAAARCGFPRQFILLRGVLVEVNEFRDEMVYGKAQTNANTPVPICLPSSITRISSASFRRRASSWKVAFEVLPGFRALQDLHFPIVHHFHQFAFLPQSKCFARTVSADARLSCS
jgi:hypothetical protein